MNYNYAYGILGSARCFLESTVEYARRDDREQWKFAIVHLETALELLLKARLAIKDPQLLIIGGTKVTERSFERGDFRSVNIEESIKRLQQISQFSLDGHQQKAFMALRSMRNRIVHHIDSTEIPEVKALVGACLNVFIEIHNAEFQDENPYNAKSMGQVIESLGKFREFVKERLDYLSPKLSSSLRPRTHHTDECSRCLQDATIIMSDKIQCLFCGDITSICDFAELISRDRTVETCEKCGRKAVAKHQWADREPTHECFCCGNFRGPEIKWSDGAGSTTPRLKDV